MIRELDNRTQDGLSVTLLWDDETEKTRVTVDETGTGKNVVDTEVLPGLAMDAFQHPFAYAGAQAAILTADRHDCLLEDLDVIPYSGGAVDLYLYADGFCHQTRYLGLEESLEAFEKVQQGATGAERAILADANTQDIIAEWSP